MAYLALGKCFFDFCGLSLGILWVFLLVIFCFVGGRFFVSFLVWLFVSFLVWLFLTSWLVRFGILGGLGFVFVLIFTLQRRQSFS